MNNDAQKKVSRKKSLLFSKSNKDTMKSWSCLPNCTIPSEINSVVNNNLRPWHGIDETCQNYIDKFQRILNKEPNVQFLNVENYVDFMRTMLYLDQFYNEKELLKYKMYKQNIKRVSKEPQRYEIIVEGLEDDTLSLVVNDQIKLIDVVTQKQYVVIITEINLDSVVVTSLSGKDKKQSNFDVDYEQQKKYNIIFQLNVYPYQCSHYALNKFQYFGLIPLLFPEKIPCSTQTTVNTRIRWFNDCIKNNPEQHQAVINIVNKSSSGLPYIIFGPPGTGKTATLIEAICQAVLKDDCNKILVCTATNDTADSLTKKLLKYLPPQFLLRFYNFAKDPKKIDEKIKSCCNCVDDQTDRDKLAKIVVCTLSTSVELSLMHCGVNCFSYVFIDDVNQTFEVNALVPMTLLCDRNTKFKGKLNGQVVLVGDPKQLRPVSTSKIASKILNQSLLERLMTFSPYKKNDNGKLNQRFITKLITNYRNHPAIIRLSNELFYENEILSANHECVNASLNKLSNHNFPIVFKQVWGIEKKVISNNRYTTNLFNEAECREVMYTIKNLLMEKTFKLNEIGIITPFTEQKRRIMKMLAEENLDKIEVGNVQLFKGREKEVMIFSTVRSKTFNHRGIKHIGSLSNVNRFNVILSRAKCLQVIIGNPNVLKIDPNWKYLIDYCSKNNAITSGLAIIPDPKKKAKKNKRSKMQAFFNSLETMNSKKVNLDKKMD